MYEIVTPAGRPLGLPAYADRREAKAVARALGCFVRSLW